MNHGARHTSTPAFTRSTSAASPENGAADDSPADTSGELITAVGLGGVLVAVGSAFDRLLDLPPVSQSLVAGSGGVLVLVGLLRRRRSRHAQQTRAEQERRRAIETD